MGFIWSNSQVKAYKCCSQRRMSRQIWLKSENCYVALKWNFWKVGSVGWNLKKKSTKFVCFFHHFFSKKNPIWTKLDNFLTVIFYTAKLLIKSLCCDWTVMMWWLFFHLLGRGWHSYTLTRWSVGHVWQDKNHSGYILCFYTTIRTYMLVHKKTRLRPISHWTFMTSLVCKVGLHYSSASINQLFNTKNSFLQLLSRKATLKCEVLF